MALRRSALGTQLATLRESRGISVAELARRIRTSRTLLSRVESSEVEPEESLLTALAAELEYTSAAFRRDQFKFGLGVSAMHYRRRASAPRSALKILEAKLNLRGQEIEILLRDVEDGASKLFFEIDLNEIDGDVQRAAELVRVAWRLPSGPVPNLVRAIEQAGGFVFCWDFGTAKVDAISTWFGSAPLFIFNSRSPADRLRHTLAHEVGHIFMHQVPNLDCEAEADQFAAHLLMPEDEFRATCPRRLTLEAAFELKRYWRVSVGSIVFRARFLKLISKELYTSLQKRISFLGYRRSEPQFFEPEAPNGNSEIVRAYSDALGIDMRTVAESRLGLRLDEFNSVYLGSTFRSLRIVG